MQHRFIKKLLIGSPVTVKGYGSRAKSLIFPRSTRSFELRRGTLNCRSTITTVSRSYCPRTKIISGNSFVRPKRNLNIKTGIDQTCSVIGLIYGVFNLICWINFYDNVDIELMLREMEEYDEYLYMEEHSIPNYIYTGWDRYPDPAYYHSGPK